MLSQHELDMVRGIQHLHSFKHITSPSQLVRSSKGFWCHDLFEVYLFISGDIDYFIEKNVYPMRHGDLFVIRNDEFHKFTLKSLCVYEKVAVRFDPSLASFFNLLGFDLLQCFNNRPKGEKNKLSLQGKQLEDVVEILNKFEILDKGPSGGAEALKLSYLLELLVLVNRIFVSYENNEETTPLPGKLEPILSYIENNLENVLTLDTIGKRFFINPSYLSSLFKSCTGENIHEYITFKRITKAKNLLLSGCSVTEACHMSGFNDYSNFIRTFKKNVGVPPGRYKSGSSQ